MAMAPTTSWVRPARRATYARACSASAGLPRMSPPTATRVSAPSVSSDGTARALRRAFSSATATGSPWVSSSTPETRTSKAMPTCSRIARRCGDADARMRPPSLTGRMIGAGRRGCCRSEFREEQGRLALAGLGRVRPVDHVGADGDREVAADRARGGLERVGGADHLARGLDRALALEDERDDRAGGDEADELAEERTLGVLGVVLLGQVLAHGHVLGRDDLQALALEARDDLTRQAARERVGLDEN